MQNKQSLTHTVAFYLCKFISQSAWDFAWHPKLCTPEGAQTRSLALATAARAPKTTLVAHGCWVSVPGRTISRARLWCHKAMAQNTGQRYQNKSAPGSVLESPYLSLMCGCPSSHISHIFLYALLLKSVQQGCLQACCAWELPAKSLFPVSAVSSVSYSQRSYNSMSNKYLQLTMATFTEWVTHKMWSGRVYTNFFLSLLPSFMSSRSHLGW